MFPENHIYFHLFGWNYLNERYGAYKYRFGLQKGVKKRNYCFLFAKYDVSVFQRTFDRFHIFKNGKVTSGLSFVSSAR